MFVVTTKVVDAGRELAETNDSFCSLLGRQLRISERSYAVTYDIRITPTMAAL